MSSLQNPSYRDPSRLREAYTAGRTLDQNDWSALSRDNLETKHHHKTQDCQPHDRVLQVSFTLLLSAQAPLQNKVSCFVTICVFLDNSLPSVRQEPILRPGRGPPSWNSFPFLSLGCCQYL